MHAAVGLLGDAAGQQRAGGLDDPLDAVARGRGVAEQRDLDRGAGPAAAVPAGRVGRRRPSSRRSRGAPAWPQRAAGRRDPRRARTARRRRTPRRTPASCRSRCPHARHTTHRHPTPVGPVETPIAWGDAVRELPPRADRQHPAAATVDLARRRRRPVDGASDGPLVLAKVEYLNPGGSVKDRIADADDRGRRGIGRLQPGGTIVEPTSGNTGVGLAMVAQAQGLPLRLRLPRQGQRGQAQRAQGVRRRGRRLPDRGRPRAPRLLLQRLRPAGLASPAPGSPTSTPTRTTRAPTTRPPARRSGSRPRAGSPTSSRGVGTGGTISGVGRYLKEQNRRRVQVDRRRPRGLGLLRRQRPAVPRRGRRRGLLARDLRPRRSPTGSSRSATPTRSR